MNDQTEHHVIHPPVTSHTPDGNAITTTDEQHEFPAALLEQRAQILIDRARQPHDCVPVARFGSAV